MGNACAIQRMGTLPADHPPLDRPAILSLGAGGAVGSCRPMLLTSVLLPGRKIIPPSVQILHTLNDGVVSGDAAGWSKASPRETEDDAAKCWTADSCGSRIRIPELRAHTPRDAHRDMWKGNLRTAPAGVGRRQASQRQSSLWILAGRRHAGLVHRDSLLMRLFTTARPFLVSLGDALFDGCLSLRSELC